MTPLFWLLLIPAVLTFGLIAWATVKACEAVERAWRRYQVRQEMKTAAKELRAREREQMARMSYVEVLSDGRGTFTYSTKPRNLPPLDVDALADLLLLDADNEVIH